MRALSLVDQNSCHAAVLMCNISDAFAGLGNVEDATGWAERGLKVGSAQSGQECDEGCGVILYNLGMLHEVGSIYFYRRDNLVLRDTFADLHFCFSLCLLR